MNTAEKQGVVYLVGAGCGAADLITVRGLRLIQSCDALVYDDLIDEKLLEEAPAHAQRVYMGKRSGQHSASQQEINEELIRQARLGRRVVRLKGGDPYLFGRGGEEMLALMAAGIACCEVPGIPSAIGIPAQMGVPVTHRGASRGLHIITGHTSDTQDALTDNFAQLAHVGGTLVFLMGLAQLERIAQRLMDEGMPGDTPAAVLSGGNSPNPADVRAPLCAIAGEARRAQVKAPAVIVVGEVAAMRLNR
ncbi:MAG: uroporphyrinogen-III C-methyltransferase [Candidatus Ventricola sp.]